MGVQVHSVFFPGLKLRTPLEIPQAVPVEQQKVYMLPSNFPIFCDSRARQPAFRQLSADCPLLQCSDIWPGVLWQWQVFDNREFGTKSCCFFPTATTGRKTTALYATPSQKGRWRGMDAGVDVSDDQQGQGFADHADQRLHPRLECLGFLSAREKKATMLRRRKGPMVRENFKAILWNISTAFHIFISFFTKHRRQVEDWQQRCSLRQELLLSC